MDKLNSEIIKLLSEDARYSAQKIATMLGKEEKDVAAAISRLEKSGALISYSIITNKEKLGDGNHVEALIEVKVTPQRNRGFDAIAEEIGKFPEVRNLFLMSGGFDIAVFIEGRTLKEVAMFVSEKLSMIENVVGTATHFILKKYKVEGIITFESENVKRMSFQP